MSAAHISNSKGRSLPSKAVAFAVGSALLTGTSLLLPAVGLAQTPSAMQVAQTEAIRATSAQEDNLYLNNNRSYSYNLITSSSTTIDGISIPAGAVIRGQYVPATGGLQYVASAVEVNGRTYPISASSAVLEDVKDPRDTSVGSVAEDAGIGAAGGLLIGEILGSADVAEAIGGAAAGAAVGNVTADRVVVVKPNDPIVLYSR